MFALAGILVGSVIAETIISSNTVGVGVTQKPLQSILLSVNGTSGTTFAGPTSPGDKLIIKAVTTPAIAGYSISFFNNGTLMESGLTDATGSVQGTYLVPNLTNPLKSDFYYFNATQT